MTLPEFIGPLSLCANTMDDQYEEYRTFTDYITGDEARRKKLEAAANGEDDDGGGGKKGKGKKKGKWYFYKIYIALQLTS